MSATNRGSKRKESDFYATPLDCIQNFLNNYDKEIVYKLITDTNYLKDNDNRLFEEAKQHMLNEKLSKR